MEHIWHWKKFLRAWIWLGNLHFTNIDNYYKSIITSEEPLLHWRNEHFLLLFTDMILTLISWMFTLIRAPFIALTSSTSSTIHVVKVGWGKFSLNRIISFKVIKLSFVPLSTIFFSSVDASGMQFWNLSFFFFLDSGRFLGEITKQVFSDLEASKYQVKSTCRCITERTLLQSNEW